MQRSGAGNAEREGRSPWGRASRLRVTSSSCLPLLRPQPPIRMLVLPAPGPRPLAFPSAEAMQAPPPRTGGSPEPGPSCSTGCPQTSPSPSRPNHYLLIDTQGVPYTVLVDEESQRETGPDGASAQKKCYSCPVCSRVFEYMSYLQRHSITHSETAGEHQGALDTHRDPPPRGGRPRP
ncbi:zinc finger protein 581 isoform X2 [Dama dama]|uniref:zinc finger protein 581 isoform X2 n=1 Tax=Dama dama TaxID=30532 RepID=UPI002A3624B3|nr:zinc finger protein 581 isoform X2 [Dama dama]